MQLTTRDRRLIEDIALHHVMTRDQVVALGYFTSVSRANRRLLTLVKVGVLERVRVNPSLEVRQALYRPSTRAADVVDHRVAALLSARRFSPMQLDHSLAVVDARIKLLALGMERWLAEPQCRHRYVVSQGNVRRTEDVRPDGVALFGKQLLFLEVDRGHMSLLRIKGKLTSFDAYVRSGMFAETYGTADPAVLFVTTGTLRKRHLDNLMGPHMALPVFVRTVSTFDACFSLREVAH